MTSKLYFAPLLLALIVLSLNCSKLMAQENVKPHLAVEAGGLYEWNQVTGDVSSHAGLSADNLSSSQPGLGLGLRFSYSWFRIRAGVRHGYNSMLSFTREYTGRTSNSVYRYTSKTTEHHRIVLQATRMPISIGIAPDWKIAPYLDLGIFVDFQSKAAETVSATRATTTEQMQHALGCGCTFWNTVSTSEEDLREQNYEYDNVRDSGTYIDLGVNFRLFPRHNLFLEGRFGSGGRTAGSLKNLRQKIYGISLGYAFQVI